MSSTIAAEEDDSDGGIDFELCKGEWVNVASASTVATGGQPESGPSGQQKPPSKAKGKKSAV